jgi:alkanesulfonate monooxygenase SsuD/methylene tetrahydromethanopterin reductase-like flavin-dependent oxidoreductase (luciferase family)
MTPTCQHLTAKVHSGDVVLTAMRNPIDSLWLCDHHAYLYNEGFLTLTDLCQPTR